MSSQNHGGFCGLRDEQSMFSRMKAEGEPGADHRLFAGRAFHCDPS